MTAQLPPADPAPGGDGPAGAAAWYAALVGGLAPVLVGGFLSSALADRLVFLAWALAVAAAYLAALRRAFTAPWRRSLRAALPLGVLALGAGLYLALALRHREALTLGFRAMLPPEGAG